MSFLLTLFWITHSWSADATVFLPKKNEKLLCDQYQMKSDGSLYAGKGFFSLVYQGKKFFSGKHVYRYSRKLADDSFLHADFTIESWDKRNDVLVLRGVDSIPTVYSLKLSTHSKDQILDAETRNIMLRRSEKYILKNCHVSSMSRNR